jgi:hypothetical protein
VRNECERRRRHASGTPCTVHGPRRMMHYTRRARAEKSKQLDLSHLTLPGLRRRSGGPGNLWLGPCLDPDLGAPIWAL